MHSDFGACINITRARQIPRPLIPSFLFPSLRLSRFFFCSVTAASTKSPAQLLTVHNTCAVSRTVRHGGTCCEAAFHILSHARSSPATPRIIHIRNNDVDPDFHCQPHSPGCELFFPPLHPISSTTLPLEPRPSSDTETEGEHVLDKHKNNAFSGTNLSSLVPPSAQLITVGTQSDFCVRATCSAALHRGNDVILIRGAHATYDRQEFRHWASSEIKSKATNSGGWAVGLGADVTPASAIEQEIEAELEEAGVVLLDMKDVPDLFIDT